MFCHLPFTDMHVFEDGTVRSCCWMPTVLGNILESGLDEIWRGEISEAIRQCVRDGSFTYCTECPYLPEAKGTVTDGVPPWVKKIMDAGDVSYLKLDYDTSCNLACPSCRRRHCTTPTDRAVRIHEAIMSSRLVGSVGRLQLTGAGDPLASRLYWQLLLDLPRVNPSARVTLFTNGLLLDADRWEAMGSTRDRVDSVIISVDAATPETYRANRGGSWEKLWRNIEIVKRLREAVRLIRFTLNYTIQENNFLELPEFIKLARAHAADEVVVLLLRNIGSYDAAEYESRAVHRPTHPRHGEFLAMLQDPVVATESRLLLPSISTM
jgi:MoaA/NifB/PqqE/SkfB family radical SAM enzyme